MVSTIRLQSGGLVVNGVNPWAARLRSCYSWARPGVLSRPWSYSETGYAAPGVGRVPAVNCLRREESPERSRKEQVTVADDEGARVRCRAGAHNGRSLLFAVLVAVSPSSVHVRSRTRHRIYILLDARTCEACHALISQFRVALVGCIRQVPAKQARC